MPFKRVGRDIYKQVDGRWVLHARARSKRNAAIMLSRLNSWMERTERRRTGRRSRRA